MIWANSLVKEPDLPSVLDYGWQVVDEKLSFICSTLPDVVKGCVGTPLSNVIARSRTAQRTVLAGRQERSAQLFVVAIVITEPVDICFK